VIGAHGTALVKIGSTHGTVVQRLKTLQTGSAHLLHVIAEVAVRTDVARIEKRVYAFLSEQRRHGEWFEVLIDTARLEALTQRAIASLADQGMAEADHKGGSGVGAQIKKARIDKGWKQQDLQAATGLSQKYLSAVELDKAQPSFDVVKRIARALAVSLDTLAKDEEAPAPEPQARPTAAPAAATPRTPSRQAGKPARVTARRTTRKAASVG
jgi:transcriptional regulator with XRE-family HTH domain